MALKLHVLDLGNISVDINIAHPRDGDRLSRQPQSSWAVS